MQLYSNNGQSTLSANVLVGDVALFVQPGHGARFPTIAGANFFYVTLESAAGAIEIVKVTTHTVGSTAMTVTRAQQGTTALAWSSGDLIELRATAAELAAFEADIDDLYVVAASLNTLKAALSGAVYTDYHNFLGATVDVVTQSDGDDSNAAASTAHVKDMLVSYAPLSNPSFTGTASFDGGASYGAAVTGVTPTFGDSSTKFATTAFVAAQAFSSSLPAQAGNAGKFITTNGTTASWALAIPDQTSNSGKYLTTDGTNASWASTTPTLLSTTRTSNTMLVATDNSTLIDITSGTFTQTFDAAAALGNGWFCYYKNSGAGEVTVGSYIMYPNEERRFSCDGTTVDSIVINPFYITATSSGTFTKPPGYRAFGGLLWGAGGSGSASRQNYAATQGGGAAACTPIWVKSSDLAASVSYAIGAGGIAVTATPLGTTDGNTGGSSTFGSFTGYGGIGGTQNSIGAAGAGIFGSARVSGTVGGYPDGNSYMFAPSGTYAYSNGAIYGGGGGGQAVAATNGLNKGGDTIYGGAGGPGCTGNGTNYTTVGSPGNSYYGATAGGGTFRDASGTAILVYSTGTSVYGGRGGAASGASTAVGVAGGVRGGGGGAAISFANVSATSGAGGRGELQLWGIL